jgi:hypothetical protein
MDAFIAWLRQVLLVPSGKLSHKITQTNNGSSGSIVSQRREDHEMVLRGGYFIADKPRMCQVGILLCFSRNGQRGITCRWVIRPYDPSWTHTTIIDALASLSHIQVLQLATLGRYSDSPPLLLQLNRLSGLKQISFNGSNYSRSDICDVAQSIANNPMLAHLEVDSSLYFKSKDVPTLHELLSKVPKDRPLQLTHLLMHGAYTRLDSFTLPHLRSLVSLDFRNLSVPPDNTDIPGDSITDIYAMLKKEKIYLKEVVIGDIDDVILDYLSSYSGLEVLDLSSIDPPIVMYASDLSAISSQTALFDGLAQSFFRSVLPQHVDSIRVLKIRPRYEGRWSYDPEDVSQAVVFSQCNKLRSFSVALNSTSSEPNYESNSDLSNPSDYDRHERSNASDYNDAVCANDLIVPSPPSYETYYRFHR